MEYDSKDGEEKLVCSTSVKTKPPASFYSQGVRVRFSSADFKIGPTPQALVELQGMFQELGFTLTKHEVTEWLDNDADDQGVQLYTDSEICDLVMNTNNDDSDDEVEEESEKKDDTCPVTNSQAAYYFEQCLTWLERQPEATAYNTTMLRELQSLAANKRVESLKQTKVSSYFHQ